MEEKYDALVPLSTYLNKDGTLGPDLKPRVDKAIEIFKEGRAERLLMTGYHWIEKTYDDQDILITEAESMKRYAVLNGIPAERILKEEFSMETVMQIFATKWLFADPNNWTNIGFESSDYHEERVMEATGHLYDPGKYQIGFEGVKTPEGFQEDLKSLEPKKREFFREQVKGVPRYDDKAHFRWLFSQHGIYNRLNLEGIVDEKQHNQIKTNQEAYRQITALHPNWAF